MIVLNRYRGRRLTIAGKNQRYEDVENRLIGAGFYVTTIQTLGGFTSAVVPYKKALKLKYPTFHVIHSAPTACMAYKGAIDQILKKLTAYVRDKNSHSGFTRQ